MYYDNFMSDILFFFGWWVQDQGLHIFEKGRRTWERGEIIPHIKLSTLCMADGMKQISLLLLKSAKKTNYHKRKNKLGTSKLCHKHATQN